MTTLEALASRVDVYSIDEAFLDLTGIDRVVSFEPFGRQAIWLKVESPDGYRRFAETEYKHTSDRTWLQRLAKACRACATKYNVKSHI